MVLVFQHLGMLRKARILSEPAQVFTQFWFIEEIVKNFLRPARQYGHEIIAFPRQFRIGIDISRPLKFVRILIPRSFSFRPMVAAVVEFAVGTMHSGVIAPYSTLFALCGGYAAMRFRKRIML